MPQIKGWVGGRSGEGGGGGWVKREDGWIKDALRRRRPSCVHSGPDRWPQQP